MLRFDGWKGCRAVCGAQTLHPFPASVNMDGVGGFVTTNHTTTLGIG